MSDIFKVWNGEGWQTVKTARQEVDGAEDFLRQEAHAYREIGRHPHIMRYDGARTLGDRLYLQLQYLDESRFVGDEEISPMEEARVVRIARGVAAALAHIHAKGYVHADVKPDNIWMGNVPMLFDFGLAEKVGLVPNAHGIRYGTPEYMMPSRLLGQSASFADDLYALGLTLYNLRTGTNPFAFARTWDWGAAGFDRFYAAWAAAYDDMRGAIRVGDHSPPFKGLLLGLTRYFDGGAAFRDGASVANFLARSFPSA